MHLGTSVFSRSSGEVSRVVALSSKQEESEVRSVAVQESGGLGHRRELSVRSRSWRRSVCDRESDRDLAWPRFRGTNHRERSAHSWNVRRVPRPLLEQVRTTAGCQSWPRNSFRRVSWVPKKSGRDHATGIAASCLPSHRGRCYESGSLSSLVR